MTQLMFFKDDAHTFRDEYQKICEVADRIARDEEILIGLLIPFDEKKHYVWFGYKSLRTFCMNLLCLTKTRSQCVVSEVRKHRFFLERSRAAAENQRQ